MSNYDPNEGTTIKRVDELTIGDELVEGDSFLLQVTAIERMPRGMFRIKIAGQWTIMPDMAGRRRVRVMSKPSGFCPNLTGK